MITALLLTFCFLNYDGSPTEDCSRVYDPMPSLAQCEEARGNLPAIVSDWQGRDLIDSECVQEARRSQPL